MVADYRSAQVARTDDGDSTLKPYARWTSHIIGFYKLNVDSSFNEIDRVAWAGMVLRGFKGDMVIAACKRFEGISSSLHAKILSIHFGSEIVQQQGIRAQFEELDSMMVIKEISSGSNLFFPWCSLILDIISFKISCGVHD